MADSSPGEAILKDKWAMDALAEGDLGKPKMDTWNIGIYIYICIYISITIGRYLL